MPAYAAFSFERFINEGVNDIIGALERGYASDGFTSQYTQQVTAWIDVIPKLQNTCSQVVAARPEAGRWTILFEYPLYRLRRRIDIVILAGSLVVVVECKVRADSFIAGDRRQVEEYALDLRDFHAESHRRRILPVLWSTDAKTDDEHTIDLASELQAGEVGAVTQIGIAGLQPYLESLSLPKQETSIVAEVWDKSPYRPVPNVIEAATSIFAKHDVRSITNADAENLRLASTRLVTLIKQAREQGKRYLLVLTGVPGSGKTLAGLHVVHDAVATGVDGEGEIVYLSGNTPLVVVLREALARDEYRRRRDGGEYKNLENIRREVRARIQHINDFLQEGLRGSAENPPHEHVIVFDEAQRAWDENQGRKKFDRSSSEPSLLLEIMSRHLDWCVCVCLVGGGQEINSGEEGVFGWGESLRKMPPSDRRHWEVFASPDVLSGGPSAGTFSIGELPGDIAVSTENDLQLTVPQRSFRSPNLSRWVNHVLAGEAVAAQMLVKELHEYPIIITRSLVKAKSWLTAQGRGERRFGLVASSGARRLRAEGIGEMLSALDGSAIAQWYLNERGDIRSSYALEVPANEYTCQGLELDFACVCWGGDFLWNGASSTWDFARLSGTAWQTIKGPTTRQHLINSYRVLLTRAREGMILWVPSGDNLDATRNPISLDATADFFTRCGAVPLPE